MMLSRLAVLYAFPSFMIAVRSIRAVFLFKRGPIADKETFNGRLDKQLAASPQSGWLVYPEGVCGGWGGVMCVRVVGTRVRAYLCVHVQHHAV